MKAILSSEITAIFIAVTLFVVVFSVASVWTPAPTAQQQCVKMPINGRVELVVKHGANRYFCRSV